MPAPANDAPALNLERFLPYRLSVLSNTVSSRIAKSYARFQLTIPEWRVMAVLEAMLDFYGDPRYRPSPWLKRRALLGLSLLTPEA